ncbi:hypothetical protein CJF31_00000730 [Rutstroemia sp. NJR-2017a BVV2]|nr:hypothetical protein CJF31_00000730 [Rutstroemia sp. NJR-2017a BVV2]PQE27841.1 hypothetical protein CJF32_00010101 [Rutstroemia sp. NJR-2017a WRK4]
MIRILNTPE